MTRHRDVLTEESWKKLYKSTWRLVSDQDYYLVDLNIHRCILGLWIRKVYCIQAVSEALLEEFLRLTR
jgi:hypothetical protein